MTDTGGRAIDFRCSECKGTGWVQYPAPKPSSILPGYVDDCWQVPELQGHKV